MLAYELNKQGRISKAEVAVFEKALRSLADAEAKETTSFANAAIKKITAEFSERIHAAAETIGDDGKTR